MQISIKFATDFLFFSIASDPVEETIISHDTIGSKGSSINNMKKKKGGHTNPYLPG